MAKKFKGRNGKRFKLELDDETKKGITAILLLVLALIAVLSAFGLAGSVGNYFYKGLGVLFGWGFFMVPLGLVIIGVLLLQSLHKDIYGAPFFGVGLFILSWLGLLQLFVINQPLEATRGGGYIGFALAYPLKEFFGIYASYIILIALIIISLLVAFNFSLKNLMAKIAAWRQKRASGQLKVTDGGKKVDEESTLDSFMKKIMPTPGFKVKNLGEQSKEMSKSAETEKGQPGKKDDFLLLQSKMVMANYKFPPLELLEPDSGEPTSGDIKANANIIKRTLQYFGIDVEMAEVNIGPTVTQYTLRPAQGVKLSKITALSNDLSMSLAAHPIRIEAPIPGRSLVGIELPNKAVTKVRLRNLLEQSEFREDHKMLTLGLGRDVAGMPVFAGLERMPHLLIAGATGTGKTICLNAIITSLLYRQVPNFLKLILIDPKRVEFPVYNGLPHLLTPVIVDAAKTINALRWAVAEMERRFEILSAVQARDIISYNKKYVDGKIEEPLPYIVIIIDELADLMASHGRDVEAAIVRLAQMSRATGIHLILATQRPSVEVITGLIKANITSRIAFQVASQVDSRTILDGAGAEKLLGNGDMLFLSGDTAKPRRVQGTFVSDKEVRKAVEFLTKQIEPDYSADVTQSRTAQGNLWSGGGDSNADDDLYESAKEIVIQSGKASASLLQRRLRVGYARAARLLDMLEDNSLVGPGDGAKPRDVLVGEAKNIPGVPKVGENDEEVLEDY